MCVYADSDTHARTHARTHTHTHTHTYTHKHTHTHTHAHAHTHTQHCFCVLLGLHETPTKEAVQASSLCLVAEEADATREVF